MSYTVKILSSENFDKLPFERAKTSLGAADAKNRVAYIRDTGYNDITKGTISHELDELMQEKSPHEIDGIRYKDMGSLFGGIGDLGKSAVGALGSGISALGRGVKNVFTPGPATAPTNLFSAPSLVGSGAADAGQFGNILGEGLSGFQKTGGSQMLPLGDTFGGAAASQAAPGIFDSLFQASGAPKGSIGTNLMPQLTQPFPGFTPSAPTAAPTQAPTAPSTGGFGDALKNLFVGKDGAQTSLQKALPGAAVSLLGGLFAPKPDVPDFSGIRSDLESRIGGTTPGASPAFDLGFGEAQRIIDAPFGVVPQELFDPIDLRLKENITALENRFRSAQGGGALSESDTSQFGRLRAQLVDQAEKEKAQLEFQYEQQQQANKITTMQTLLDLDQAQFAQYAKLAELDVSELMMQTGVDTQTATEFKQLFSGVGEAMISDALNPQQATA